MAVLRMLAARPENLSLAERQERQSRRASIRKIAEEFSHAKILAKDRDDSKRKFDDMSVADQELLEDFDTGRLSKRRKMILVERLPSFRSQVSSASAAAHHPATSSSAHAAAEHVAANPSRSPSPPTPSARQRPCSTTSPPETPWAPQRPGSASSPEVLSATAAPLEQPRRLRPLGTPGWRCFVCRIVQPAHGRFCQDCGTPRDPATMNAVASSRASVQYQ